MKNTPPPRLLVALFFAPIFHANAATNCDKTEYHDYAKLAGNPELLAEAKHCGAIYEMERQREMESICKKGFTDQYYQECIIEKMPGARNKVAVAEAVEYCGRKAPCTFVKSKRGGVFGVTTANGCFEKYGERHPLPSAASYIQSACYDLYEDK